MNFKLFFLCLVLSLFSCKAPNTLLYVGTYTNGDSKGIYQAKFNTETGELSHLELAVETDDPSYIAYAPSKKYIYAVNESGDGSVSSFIVKGHRGLQLLNTVPSNGGAPCYISINAEGNKAVVSNYLGGNVSLYEISSDGTLQEAYQIFDYNAPDKVSHAHSAQFFNNLLLVSDLGTDSVYQYQLNTNGKTYDVMSSSAVSISEKAGPRHFALTKDGLFLYNINEYASTITASKKENNTYKLIDNYTTLETDFKEFNACADIHISKDERYLYGSNRGENSIAVFKRNSVDGTLQKIQNMPVHGDWPRNFTLDPTGKFLLVANKKSNNISVFKIDTNTGTLAFLYAVETPAPVCLLF